MQENQKSYINNCFCIWLLPGVELMNILKYSQKKLRLAKMPLERPL